MIPLLIMNTNFLRFHIALSDTDIRDVDRRLRERGGDHSVSRLEKSSHNIQKRCASDRFGLLGPKFSW